MKKIAVILIALSLLLSTACLAERGSELPPEAPTVSVPEADEIRALFFEPVAQWEEGTAGCSLKQASAAAGLLRFVDAYRLWESDVPALRANMLSAWESLDADAQGRFDGNIPGFAALIDEAFSDYTSVAGQFEDAGAEDMADLSADPDIREGWRILLDNFHTMGNSDE